MAHSFPEEGCGDERNGRLIDEETQPNEELIGGGQSGVIAYQNFSFKNRLIQTTDGSEFCTYELIGGFPLQLADVVIPLLSYCRTFV